MEAGEKQAVSHHAENAYERWVERAEKAEARVAELEVELAALERIEEPATPLPTSEAKDCEMCGQVRKGRLTACLVHDPDLPTNDGTDSVADLIRRAAALMRASKRGEVQAHVKEGDKWIELTLPEHRPTPDGPRSETALLDTLIVGVMRAENALNIDMGDGEPTYQCCNAVCGHPPSCLVGQAIHALIDARLIFWNRAAKEWQRTTPTQTGSEGT